ncbi:hypothetical protein [Peterkaempfera bronchialis]|uniref:hypothetical protein n=1 Tax=Peterkaempfera bronchialis TaxID=2126346 RepID=UPI003C2C9266
MVTRPSGGGSPHEMTDLLAELAEQVGRCQSDLVQAQARMRSLCTQVDDRRAAEPGGTAVVTAGQAAALVVDLLVGGARQLRWIRPGEGTLILGFPAVRDRVLTAPGVALRALLGAGSPLPSCDRGEVRAAPAGSRELLIVDDSVALLPATGGAGGAGGAGAAGQAGAVVVVRQAAVVEQLVWLFETAWGRVEDERPAPEVGAEPEPFGRGADAELKRRIIGLLADGAKDEVVARRLGISLRTCRRHVADILHQLGAVSRFQAGVQSVRLGISCTEQQTVAG